MLRGCAEAGVRLGGVLAHDGDEIVGLGQLFRRFEQLFVGAVRAAEGKAQAFLVFHAHSSLSLMTERMAARISSAAV